MKKQRVFLAGLLFAGATILGACEYNANIRYNVDFYVDGKVYKSVGTDGKNIDMPQDPYKEGYQFDGWYTQENGEGDLVTLYTLLDQPLSEDMRLNIYAHFLEELTVTYVTGTNEVIDATTYVEGDTISALTPETVPENMLFGGWYTDQNYTTKWDFETELTTDVTLYANWLSAQVTLTYDYNIDGIEDKTVQTNRFEKAESFTPDPIPDYEFIGWYLDKNYTQAFDYNQDTVDEDLTLYGKWLSEFVTVTFDYQHTELENTAIKIRRGTAVMEVIPETTPLYHVFLGWFTRQYYGEQWNFDNVITQDTTLYAYWEDHTGNFSIVTLITPNGNNYTLYTKVGETLNEPYLYVPTGQRFVGWFRDETYTQPWDIANDGVDSEKMTLYAKFEDVYITVTLKIEGETQTHTVKYGDVLTLPTPKKEDYYLDGWQGVVEGSSATITCDDTFHANRLENVTFTPIFKSIFQFTKINSVNAYELTSITLPTQKTISIPAEYNGFPVTSIASKACWNRNGFHKLIIPDSVEHIGESAFTACHGLQEVTIGSGTKEIGKGAFSDCSALTKVTFIGNALTKLGDGVFARTAITNLTLPDSLETFSGITYCEKLTHIDLGKIKHLTGGFNGTALQELIIPETVETITADVSEGLNMIIYAETESKPEGWISYWNASNLPVVWDANSNNTVKQDNMLFAATKNGATLIRCESLATTVSVPETVVINGTQYPVTELGSNAFYMLSNLQNLSLPDTLEKVSLPQFIGCNNLVYHEENGVIYLGNTNNPYLILKDLTRNQNVLTVPAQTRIILGHSPSYYYTDHSIKALAFEDNSNLKCIGPSFFSWAYDSYKNISLPAGVKYIGSAAFSGKTTNIFVPETSKPDGWTDDWFRTTYLSANVYYGVTQDAIYKTNDATYLLQNGEATLVNLFGNGTGICELPSVLTVNGETYPLTKIGAYALSHLKTTLDGLFIPETVQYFEPNYDTSNVYVHAIFIKAEALPETWSEDWQPFGLSSNNIFFGVSQDDYIITDDAHYIASEDYATAYLYVGETVIGGNSMFLLPTSINVQGKELPVSHIHRSFIESVQYVTVILQESVTHIPAGKTYGYGTQFFTTHASQPEGWEDGWNEAYSGFISVTYGLTGLTATEKTYTFVTEGTAVQPITAYFLAKSPSTTVTNGKYFWGWYEDAAFSGKPIEFPYMGEGKTLYARFETTKIQDGKSYETAYDLSVGSYQSITIDKAGEIVYFKYTATASKTCLFKSRGDYDTYGVIYHPTSIGLERYKIVAEADSGGTGENFSVSYQLSSGFTYYFALRLVDNTQTGSFEFIVTLA